MFAHFVRLSSLLLSCSSALLLLQAQQPIPNSPSVPSARIDSIKERDRWFYRGRLMAGTSTAQLRHRAYSTKMQLRSWRAAERATRGYASSGQTPFTGGSWKPLGPAPLESDGSGTGLQDYG